MLAGRPPFTESSVVELALRHVHDPPPALPAGTPGALAAIVKCALAKSPARRYSSGGTMADALGCARASLAAQDQPRRIGRRAAAAALATAVTRARGNSDHAAVTTVTPPEPQLSDHTSATERLSWPPEHPGATRVKPPLTPRKTVNPAAGRRRAAALTSVFLLLVAMVGAAIVIGSVDHVRVPSLRGLRLASITTRTRRLHLRVSFDNRFSNLPGGTAISQIPATGTRVRDGATVRVVLSAGPPPVELPQLKGQAYAAAQHELQRLGLRAGVTEVPAPGVAAGTVTYQAPAAGSESRLGSTVSLSVAETPRWRPLTSLAGDGRGRSVPFRILGSRWRVLYSMAYQGTCTLIFFCSGPSAQVANQGSGSDTSGFDLNDGSGQTQLFKSGPGLYQITVSPGRDTARWSIQVQDYY